jgi:hypothetical protein
MKKINGNQILEGTLNNVIEVPDYDHLPENGKEKTIYITKDNNYTYRWDIGELSYVSLSQSSGSGEGGGSDDNGLNIESYSYEITPDGITKIFSIPDDDVDYNNVILVFINGLALNKNKGHYEINKADKTIEFDSTPLLTDSVWVFYYKTVDNSVKFSIYTIHPDGITSEFDIPSSINIDTIQLYLNGLFQSPNTYNIDRENRKLTIVSGPPYITDDIMIKYVKMGV